MLNLEYTGRRGEECFRSQLEGSKVAFTPAGGWKTPNWRSWAGFYGWINTIQTCLGLTHNQAHIALLQPKEDYSWVLDITHDQSAQIAKALHPFLGGDKELPLAKAWIESGLRISYNKYKVFKNLIDTLHIGNMWTFKHAQHMGPNPNFPKAFTTVKWECLDQDQIGVLGCFGEIRPSFVEAFKKDRLEQKYGIPYWEKWDDIGIIYNTIKKERKFHIKMESMKYYPTVGALTDMGFAPSELIPGDVYTKKEKAELVKLLRHTLCCELINENVVLSRYIINMTGLPEGWHREIKTKMVADWAVLHKNKLERKRTIYGPAGTTQDIHYHQLLSKVTDDMLTQGVKTSWDKVMKGLEEEAKKELEAKMGENVDLPILKVKVEGAVQLTTTHQLRDEGNKMDHCVGMYYPACLSRQSYIFHIGSSAPDGATLEVCPINGIFKAQQIYRSHNMRVEDEKILSIVDRLIDTLNKRR